MNSEDQIVESEQELSNTENVKIEEDPLISKKIIDSRNYFKAIEMNYSIALNSIIESGVDITGLNDMGYNALHYAALLLNVEMMETLINAGKFDIEAKTGDEKLDTALIVACKNTVNKEKAVVAAKFLIKYGANIESVNDDNFTSLAAAINVPNFALADYLLKLGANANARVYISDDNQTLLHLAIINNDRDIMKSLIEHKADMFALNGRNMAPIHEAAVQNWIPGMRELVLTRYVDKNSKSPTMEKGQYFKDLVKECMFGATPLHYAANNNSFEVVKFLLLIQADLNAKDEFGRKALFYAGERRNIEIRDYLDKRWDWEWKHPKKQDVEKLIRENEYRPIEEKEELDQLYIKKYLQK